MDKMREAFEEQILADGGMRGDLTKIDGEYRFSSVGERWEDWQKAWRGALTHQPRWIPCSERPPTEDDPEDGFLVSLKGMRHVMAVHGLYGDCWVHDGGTLALDDVSHWMPFPQPPEGV